jgi:hypothetical protein
MQMITWRIMTVARKSEPLVKRCYKLPACLMDCFFLPSLLPAEVTRTCCKWINVLLNGTSYTAVKLKNYYNISRE